MQLLMYFIAAFACKEVSPKPDGSSMNAFYVIRSSADGLSDQVGICMLDGKL